MMKRLLFFSITVFLLFVTACGEQDSGNALDSGDETIAVEEPIIHEELKIAKALLNARKYEECLSHLNAPYKNKALEERRLLLRVLVYAWTGFWNETVTELNQFMALTGKPKNIPHIRPRSLKDREAYNEFESFDFTYDDARYLWRVLWQDRIVSRITENIDSEIGKTVKILDFVYRHVKFGTIEGGHINDKPFNVLVKGQGFCEELAWVANQLLRAAGLDAARLILWWPHEEVSPHTISMVKIGEHWIAVDPTAGLILQGAKSRKPKGMPQHFIIEPTDEKYRAFGNKVPSFGSYLEAIKDFGQYNRLNVTIPVSHPFFDFELETCTPRFLWLGKRLEEIVSLPGFSHPYVTSAVPSIDPRTGKILKWQGIELKYIFESTHKKNAARYQLAHKRFAFIRSIQFARLALLSGQYPVAEKMFAQASQSDTFTPEAREDTVYYLSVSAYEQEQYELARQRFGTFLRAYPASRWKSRVKYQLALIAYAQGRNSDIPELLQACEQESEASFFHWMTEMKFVKRQKIAPHPEAGSD